jgi:hypothetical protein
MSQSHDIDAAEESSTPLIAKSPYDTTTAYNEYAVAQKSSESMVILAAIVAVVAYIVFAIIMVTLIVVHVETLTNVTANFIRFSESQAALR